MAAAGATEQRWRLLPTRLVVALVVALGRWARAGRRDVRAPLVQGLRARDPTTWAGWAGRCPPRRRCPTHARAAAPGP